MAWKVIEILGGSFSLFVIILITLYAGELVWRERDLKIDGLKDGVIGGPDRDFIFQIERHPADVYLVHDRGRAQFRTDDG